MTPDAGGRANHDPVSRLAELLAGNAAAAREVAEARERPDEYVKAHKTSLTKRGVSVNAPPGDLAWIVLMDELLKRRRAVAVDWRGLPEEVAADLRRMQRDVGEVATRCLGGALRSGTASAFLTCVAKGLEATDRVLARIDPRPGDTAVVLVLDREDFKEAAALARQSGIGRVVAVTAEPLALPPPPKASAPKATPKGSWKAILQELGVGNEHALLLRLARGEIQPETVTPVVGKAPVAAREVIRATLALLAGERLPSKSAADRITSLAAIQYLIVAPGRELNSLRLLLDVVREIGEAKAGLKERRAAVQALRVGAAAERGRTAFARLEEDEQRVLRELVSNQLDSNDVSALTAALGAARVAGHATLVPQIKSLTQHPSLLVAQEAKETLRVLSRK
jgi:hypothetical protein